MIGGEHDMQIGSPSIKLRCLQLAGMLALCVSDRRPGDSRA